MPEIIAKTMPDFLKLAGPAIIAGVVAFTTTQVTQANHAVIIQDHESRLRVTEVALLTGLGDLRGDIKSEFHGIKIRLTALEKAVDRGVKVNE